MLWNLDYRELNTLEKELEQLPPLHRVAFAASICERMLPNYSAFATEEGRGNPVVLRAALDEVWQILQGKLVDAETIHQLINNCEGLPPDEDDDGTYMYEASMTRTAICYVLSTCLEPTPQNVAKIARLVGDLLFEDIVIEREIANPNWRNKKSFDEQVNDVASHPFWVREVAKENEDLQRLKAIKTLDQKFIKWLRTSFDNGGKSLLDLS